MGLDMYIYGRGPGAKPEKGGDGDYDAGAEARGQELAYWRKHPRLHCFIVQTLAGGVDECQEIPLDAEQIELILTAVERDVLPAPAEGFFFGNVKPANYADTIGQLDNVLFWLQEDTRRSVYYRASW